ncbi:MAG: RluA family pseudouridine synthase [Oscillospiraceae bacterium]|nr:RluA family pseudouridine synthase [Oscillospiraceae bacterium]
MSEFVIVAESDDAGIRLDRFVAEKVEGVSRSAAAALIDGGKCTVNGGVFAKKYLLKSGDSVKVTVNDLAPVDILPEDIPLDILFEDEFVIIVNKPREMIVHPAAGVYSGTLVNALMFRCKDSLSGINGIIRPGIVHRIDKDTSGLVAVAKNDIAHLSLAEQLKNRTMLREYEAIVHGRLKKDNDTINAPIGRSVTDRKKMCVTAKNSREATTYYETVARYNDYTHIRARLHTGRTHQIRVHMAYIGHSVAGDTTYGNGKPASLNGQCLHAKKLGFVHPKTGVYMETESELPEYFKEFIEGLLRDYEIR